MVSKRAAREVYVLGGYQTDFSRNWSHENKHVVAMLREVVQGALHATRVSASELQVGHVGNFAAELFCMQGHLGALLVEVDPALRGLPTSRHEGACASGSLAALAAEADIESGRYDVALVVGVEQMKTVEPKRAGDYLGTAAWYEKEARGTVFPFPRLFGRLGDEYDKRFGLKDEHLARIAAINYDNARLNPNALTRTWFMSYEHACSAGRYNPVIGERLKLTDCSQITDGAAAIVLASAEFAHAWARRTGASMALIPRILGWGHRTAPLELTAKLLESEGNAYVLPHTRRAILDAYERAGLSGPWDLSAIETHDCFTTAEYMAIDHFGLTEPGESWRAIEEGVIAIDGKLPVNPSGGLLGVGHPVGATGTRQMLDAWLQVTERAGDFQVKDAKRVATLNLGGAGTTTVVHVIGV